MKKKLKSFYFLSLITLLGLIGNQLFAGCWVEVDCPKTTAIPFCIGTSYCQSGSSGDVPWIECDGLRFTCPQPATPL